MGGDGMGVPSGVDVRPRHQVRQVRAEPRSWEVPQNGQAEPSRRHGIEETHLPQHDAERAVP